MKKYEADFFTVDKDHDYDLGKSGTKPFIHYTAFVYHKNKIINVFSAMNLRTLLDRIANVYGIIPYQKEHVWPKWNKDGKE